MFNHFQKHKVVLKIPDNSIPKNRILVMAQMIEMVMESPLVEKLKAGRSQLVALLLFDEAALRRNQFLMNHD